MLCKRDGGKNGHFQKTATRDNLLVFKSNFLSQIELDLYGKQCKKVGPLGQRLTSAHILKQVVQVQVLKRLYLAALKRPSILFSWISSDCLGFYIGFNPIRCGGLENLSGAGGVLLVPLTLKLAETKMLQHKKNPKVICNMFNLTA